MKNFKNIICIILSLALISALAACGTPAQPEPTTAPAVTDSPEPSTAPVLCDAEPAVAAEFAIDRFLQQIVNLESFTDAEGEYANKVLFTAIRDIKDFRYLEISADVNEDGSIKVNSEKELYKVDSMLDGQPLLITVQFNGTVPDRAISYVDDCGGTHYFYLALSGEDNVPLLVPMDLIR